MPRLHCAPILRRLLPATLALAVVLAGRPAAAQLPSASAPALGVGDNYTALARGRNAAAWNPAGLAMPDNPAFSIGVVQLRGLAGVNPITTADLKGVEGTLVPQATKEEWLERITAEGGQQGAFGADLTYLSLNLGRIGIQLSSTVTGMLNLAPDAAELLLFGNAGRTGEPRDFSFEGSAFDVAATSTVALSYAQPLSLELGPLPDQHFAFGATLKYTVGHALFSGWDNGSALNDDPLAVGIEFPVIQTDTAIGPHSGAGVGLDLGASWQGGPFAAGLVVRNVINTFAWDESKFFFRAGTATFNADTSYSNFDAREISAAPTEIQARAAELAEELTYKPSLALGVAVQALPILTVMADVRRQLGDGMDVGPATHLGIGAELRLLPFLPLRAGATKVSGGLQLGGGVGLEVGPLNLGLSAARRTNDFGTDGIGMFSLSFGGN